MIKMANTNLSIDCLEKKVVSSVYPENQTIPVYSGGLGYKKSGYNLIGPFSNEIEYNIIGGTAKEIISSNSTFQPEVNGRDVVEITVSMKDKLSSLNYFLSACTNSLDNHAKRFNSNIYGGSFVYEDVSDLEMDNSLKLENSKNFRGFMNISGQQIVIGIKDEKKGWELYNTMNYLSPVFLAITTSSPYLLSEEGSLVKTGLHSIRPSQYHSICSSLPEGMWRNIPEINSIREHDEILEKLLSQVRKNISEGKLNTNWNDLTRTKNEYSFDKGIYYWEDKDVYWLVRPRPSHETISMGGNCFMSLEFRAPDLPVTLENMKTINRFIIGLCNYVTNTEEYFLLDKIKTDGKNIFDSYYLVGERGMNCDFAGKPMRRVLETLLEYSVAGLEYANEFSEARKLKEGISKILTKGTDSENLLKMNFKEASEIKRYLNKQLRS
jgi:gamma-glutamyl:cysteine ligase YbdK (ATP-grasp superfamily)